MACPIHLWVPLMAAAAPAARYARHRLALWRAGHGEDDASPPERPLRRWAPVGAISDGAGPERDG